MNSRERAVALIANLQDYWYRAASYSISSDGYALLMEANALDTDDAEKPMVGRFNGKPVMYDEQLTEVDFRALRGDLTVIAEMKFDVFSDNDGETVYSEIQ